MNIKSYIKKSNNNRSDTNAFIYILNQISHMVTGFNEPKIHFKYLGSYFEDSHVDELGLLYLYYNLSDEGQYQYNNVIVKDYKIIGYDGNGTKQISQLFELLELIDETLVEKYDLIDKTVFQVFKTLERDASIERPNFFKDENNKLDKETLNKINKLNEIHQGLLLNYSNEDIINILSQLISSWEIDNFNIVKKCEFEYSWNNYVIGRFSNMDIPNICIDNSSMIIFPDGSRSSICSDFLIVMNFEDIKFNEGDIIKLKNIRKGSKENEYKFLEKSCYGYIAVRNIKTNKIEFLTSNYIAEFCYDALFDCNKLIYKGWFNKRVKYIE